MFLLLRIDNYGKMYESAKVFKISVDKSVSNCDLLRRYYEEFSEVFKR